MKADAPENKTYRWAESLAGASLASGSIIPCHSDRLTSASIRNLVIEERPEASSSVSSG
jgi:hypothetical protein